MDYIQEHKDGCLRCNLCIDVCPQYDDFSIVDDLYDYLSGASSLPKGDIRKCFTCNVCTVSCPENLGSRKLISLAREKNTTESGPSEVQGLADPFAKNNMYIKIGEMKAPLLFKNEMKKADVLYFPGCAATCMNQVIGRATIAVLEASGVDYSVLSGVEYCCGSVANGSGNTEPLLKIGPKNLNAIEEIGAKLVITTCPGCYRAFKNIYPEVFGELPFETLQTSEYFFKLIEESKLNFDSDALKEYFSLDEIKVYYQDPCHLTRAVGIYDTPRKALSAIPNVSLVNPSPEGSICCGFGGGVRTNFPSISLKQSANVHEIAKSKGADAIITNCGGCMKNIIEGKTDESGSEIPGSLKVFDFAEFLTIALGSKPVERDDYLLLTLSNRALLECLDCYKYDRYGFYKEKPKEEMKEEMKED
ncbi:MAG: (Fe-S)-binding protein [Methanosarcinaceae archaeon]|nr:(Fe-S)-binding protein [Methanosarcinaceae archaeon]